MKTTKIETGHYQIKENGKTYDIKVVGFTPGSNGKWDIFVTDSENQHEWSMRLNSKKECLEWIKEMG